MLPPGVWNKNAEVYTVADLPLEQALELGFTGVMYDGSTLPYEENAENTRKAVAMAKKYGANVEAEIVFTTSDPNREWKIPAAEFTITATYA